MFERNIGEAKDFKENGCQISLSVRRPSASLTSTDNILLLM